MPCTLPPLSLAHRSLDRHLSDLGPLDNLPTPSTARVTGGFPIQCTEDDNAGLEIYEDRKTLRGVSKKFSQIIQRGNQSHSVALSTVIEYLERTYLPIETIALAYNILEEQKASDNLHKRHDSAGGPLSMAAISSGKKECSAEMKLLVSFQLAACYVDKSAGAWNCWAELASEYAGNSEELWNASADMLERMGWRMCLFASPVSIDSALHTLEVKQSSPRDYPPSIKQRKSHARPYLNPIQTGYFD